MGVEGSYTHREERSAREQNRGPKLSISKSVAAIKSECSRGQTAILDQRYVWAIAQFFGHVRRKIKD